MASGDATYLILFIAVIAGAGVILWRVFRRPIDRGPDPTPRDVQNHDSVIPGGNPPGANFRRR